MRRTAWLLLLLLPLAAQAAPTRYQILADTTTIKAGDLLQVLGRADIDSAQIDTLYGTVFMPAGARLTVPYVDVDTLKGNTLMQAGERFTAAAIDVDSLLNALRTTGLLTAAAGVTVPAGQTLTAAAADVDTLSGGTLSTGALTLADLDATAGTISSNATTWSFDDAFTLDSSGDNTIIFSSGASPLNITGSDLTVYHALNNADPSLSLGTSATERLLIQALNGAANQSLESLNIVTQTAAAGANAGQITIGVDDATILTIDDGGINAILGATTAAAATVTTLTASSTVNISTATNWQLGGVAYTGTMANLNTLRDDSMADALHRHSELSASDGTPNPAVQVDAAGLVGIGGTPSEIFEVIEATATLAALRVSTEAVNNTTYLNFLTSTGINSDANQLGSIGAIITQATPSALKADMTFRTNAGDASTEWMRLSAAGQLLVGHTASVAVGGYEAYLQVPNGFASVARWAAETSGPVVSLGHSRNATKGSFTILQDNDILGQLTFSGDDGTDLATIGAAIIGRVNGIPAANDIPGEIELATYDGGAQTGSLILDAAGTLMLSTSTDATFQFQETGTWRYYLSYSSTNNYFRLATTDSDGGGTDADVIRIPDGQLTVDGNTTFDANAFDWVCERDGWHGPDRVEACPICGGPVEWHDDVELLRKAIRDLRQDPETVGRLSRLGVAYVDSTTGHLYTSMNRAPWLAFSAIVQEKDARTTEDVLLRQTVRDMEHRLNASDRRVNNLEFAAGWRDLIDTVEGM